MDYLYNLLYSQLFVELPYPATQFTDQVIIVTGANSGLGLEATRHLVRLNAAKVILAVRDVRKGLAASDDIQASTLASEKRVEVWELDLTSFSTIKAFSARVDTLERLDAVIQNAGIYTPDFKTCEGNESTFATNVIGPALLAFAVLPKLRESARKIGRPGRMTFNGSNQQSLARFDEQYSCGSLFEALNREDVVDMKDRYATCKRLLLYLVLALTAKNPLSSISNSNVIISYCVPGVARSNIIRGPISWHQALIMEVIWRSLARTTEHGSRALVDAIRPDISWEMHGAYLRDCKIDTYAVEKYSGNGRALQERFANELFAYLENCNQELHIFKSAQRLNTDTEVTI